MCPRSGSVPRGPRPPRDLLLNQREAQRFSFRRSRPGRVGTALLLGLLAWGCGAAQISTQLDGYWPFDESNGLVAADLATAANAGNLHNFSGDQAHWGVGQVGGALTLGGPATGQYVRVPDYPKPTLALSVAAWVRADARPVWASIAKNWGGSQTGQFHFGLTSSDGDLSCYLTMADGRQISVRENARFPLGDWQHVAFTADGVRLRLFRNGMEVAGVPCPGQLLQPPMPALGIGVKLNDAGVAPDSGAPGFWQGSIDDLGIWARALDPAEVTAIFLAGQQGRPLTNAQVVPPAPGPTFGAVSHFPPSPDPNGTLSITCLVTAATAPITKVTLLWRVMFGPVRSTSMVETAGGFQAALAPGAAGDPPWQPGDLVRWRFTATDSQGNTSRWPPFTNAFDSAEYVGTVIAPDAAAASPLPILHWFVESPAQADSDLGTRCSLFHRGGYYDNVAVRIRGGTSRSWPKKSYKFEFNSREKFFVRDDLPRVTEFDLNTTYTDKSYVRSVLAAGFQRDAGLPSPENFHVHVRQNGQFFSVAIYTEHPDERFLRRHGLDDAGAFYKALGDPLGTYEKKTRLFEDDADLKALLAGLSRSGSALETFLFDQLCLPNVINYMAAVAITQNIDASDKNHYLHRDTNVSREWRILPWDLDLTFGPDYLNTDTIVYNLCDLNAPHCPSHPFIGARPYLLHPGKYHPLFEAIIKTPRTRHMLLRRIRTLTDDFLGAGYFQARLDELFPQLDADVLLDHVRWQGAAHFPGRVDTLRQAMDRLRQEYLEPRVGYLRGNAIPGIGPDMPQAQPLGLILSIGEVEVSPASGNQEEEYIRLDNSNALAVDLSGWLLTGAVRHTFAAGTVIPAGDSLYACRSAAAFRARASGPGGGRALLVQGNYAGQLNARGETLALADPAGRWVATTNLPAAPSLAQRYLRITELMYHPGTMPGGVADPGLMEFLELRNISAGTPLDLRGIRFSAGIGFAFSDTSTTALEPGASILLVRNLEAFTLRYGPNLPVFGQYTGALDNAGERLRLEDAAGEKILEFSYDPSWFPITDGGGASLVIVNEHQTWTDWGFKAGWRPTIILGGSPGLPEPAVPSFQTIHHEGDQVLLKALVPMGLSAQLEVTPTLDAPRWEDATTPQTAVGDPLNFLHSVPIDEARFYRLRTW